MKNRKYMIGFCLLAIALFIMVAKNFKQSMQYYMTVSEFYQQREKVSDREFRLSGRVVEGSILKKNPAKPQYSFDIIEGGQRVAVEYHGFAPDTFNDKSTVVVRGYFDDTKQVFFANHLLAKCASKYEAKLSEGEQS
jgi:cytochrome c-type biogenesis protein CcmE